MNHYRNLTDSLRAYIDERDIRNSLDGMEREEVLELLATLTYQLQTGADS